MSHLRSYCFVPFLAMVMVLGGCSNSSPPISVSLSTASSPTIDQSQSITISATLMNDRNFSGVSWSLNGPGSFSVNGESVTYSSPASVISKQEQATVTATSVADPTKSASLTITVNPYPRIPVQNLAVGTVGVPYSQALPLTGGTAPFQWGIYDGPIPTGWQVGGALPDGLTLDASSGTVSGTPSAAGTWSFETTVVDAVSSNTSNGFLNIRINPAGVATANAVPFLDQTLQPAAVSPGAGALTLHVSGAGFTAAATVDFNGAPLQTTFVDNEHLSATVPATDIASAETATVTVVNPAPGGGSSNVAYFEVGAPETTVSFANAPNSPLKFPEPDGLAIGDFNEDRSPDLAIAANWRLYTILGNGDGTFAAAPGSPMLVPSPPYNDFASPYVGSMAVGDFNHSGHLGLAVAEIQNEAAVILVGNGNGSFAVSSAAFANAAGMPTVGAEAADLNADGNLDLALVSQILGSSIVDLGYGKGAFNAAGTLYTNCWIGKGCGFPGGAAIGDFNGDGKLDVAIASGGSVKYPYSGVAVSLGTGGGRFQEAAMSPFLLGQNLTAILAGDFNGDGKLDLAVTDSVGNEVFILLGNGDGTFLTPIAVATGNAPTSIVEGDFNDDGKLDLAVANAGDNTVTLLLGNGDGTFTPAPGSPYAVGAGPDALVAADFNGDGKLDLAVANGLDGTVSILLQQ